MPPDRRGVIFSALADPTRRAILARLAQWRPCALVPDPLDEAARWLEDCRNAWEEGRPRRRDGS